MISEKKIAYSITAKAVIAIVNFLLLIITAKQLGAEGRGLISIFIVNVSICVLIAEIIGGTSLVYLVPRKNISNLIFNSYLWAALVSICTNYIAYTFTLIDSNFILYSIAISFLTSTNNINQSILNGKNLTNQGNSLGLIQALLMFSFFYFSFYIYNNASFFSYIICWLLSSFITTSLGLIWLKKHLVKLKTEKLFFTFKEMFRLGSWIQLANFIQLLNNRFSYYVIYYFSSNALVGLFSTASSIAESIWVVSSGIATVQYSFIANSNDKEKSYSLSSTYIKYVFIFLCITSFMLLILPKSIYTVLLGNEFSDIKTLLYCLLPGIICLGSASMISHYFSGQGNTKVSTAASLTGLIFVLILAPLGMYVAGITGVAISVSVSLIANAATLVFFFRKEYKTD